jgi:hypothetical protein
MFDEIKAHLQALETAVTGGDIPGALHAFGDVSHDAGDLAGLFFATPPGATPDPDKDECKDCCERIKAAAAAAPAPVAAGPQPVGAWGDGTFLKIVLPVFLDWLMKWFKS